MPQLPESVTIVTRDGEPCALHIDGAEFPWCISSQGFAIDNAGGKISRLEIAILVDTSRIEFKEEER